MPTSRVAHLTFMPFAYPRDLLPHCDGPLDLTVEGLAELLPSGRAVLLGLRDGGWRFCGASVHDGAGEDASGTPLRDIPMSFTKEFSPPDVALVVADLRACGATEDWGYPDFQWEDDREEDDDGVWDVNGERIR